MYSVVVHQNDALPSQRVQIIDQDNGDVAVDLSPPTTVVTAKLREKGKGDVLQTVTAIKVRGGGATGYVDITWPSDAFDVDAGVYEVEISIDFDGEVQTVNRYYWRTLPEDDDDTLPIKVKEEF